MNAPRVLVHVQHLLGSGHTRRAAAIARRLALAGAEVLLASGGMPLPHLDSGAARLLQLAPMRSRDAGYREMLDADGRPLDDAWRAARRDTLLAAAAAFRPHALLVETFPFGRRMLRFELLPLIEALRAQRPPALVFASVRDILEPPRKPERVEQTLACLQSCFDAVLVHGDAALAPLSVGFPAAARIAVPVHHTGYVLEHEPGAQVARGAGEVLVSAGGGDVGDALLECALQTQPLMQPALRRWRLLVSPAVDEARFSAWRRRAPSAVTVERHRADFRALLASAAVSVSQAGYNTLVEGLAAGTRLVAVPFAEAGEQEQTLRARCFAEAGLLACVGSSELRPDSLAAALLRAPRAARRPALDGAAVTARLLLEALARR